MLTQGSSRPLTVYIFAVMLAAFVAGCGGGPEDNVPVHDPTTPTAVKVIDVVARTGPIVAVRVGETVILEGSKSFTSSTEPLSYSWSFSSKPEASEVELQNSTTANPSFIADARGSYMVQLVVSAEGISSQRAIQLVEVTIDPERFTGPFNHQGLSSNCVNCHNDGFGTIPAKSLNHVATTNTCETCHTTRGFEIIPFVDHQEVFGNCSECHNGVLAVGKSEFHAPTMVECDDCHNTTSFLTLLPDGSFDHSSITRSCSGCHNGTVAIGKTPTPPHPDTNAECGFCHTTVTFLGAYPDHTGPLVVGAGITCVSCHDGTTATGEPVGHPVMNVDCATCHSIVTFSLGGVFNHRLFDPTVQSCETCHNDTNSINALGKTPTPPHPDTSTDCGFCHNTTSFSDATFDHVGIDPNDCASCHGVSAIGKSVNHMPTIDDCSVCHTPGTFTTGIYDHVNLLFSCATCHDNLIGVGKLPNHFPTNPDNQDCVDCHVTTGFLPATFDHVGIVDNCASCHDGVFSTGKPVTHLPTVQDCYFCHNTAAPFKPATNFAHVGINGNCESCHDGSTNNVTVGAIGKASNHIPALNECSVCHDVTNTGGFASSTFLASTHPGIVVGCEGCHVSQFLPLPTNPTANVVKTASHLPTNQDCVVCHNTAAFTPTTMLAHEGITGNCVSCHDGSTNFVALGARGKAQDPTPPHPTTTADCALCHNTTNFLDAFVDHSDPAVLAVRCDSCHGVTATGKGAKIDHVATIEDCGACHIAGGTFAPAVFNHTGIVDNCASCHDGITATGKDAKINPPHIATVEDCSVCHIPTVFADARFDHQGIIDNCASCHDGNTATGKANNHVPTNGDCSDCHVTTGFLPATFDHVGIVDNCASCHDAGLATPKKLDHVATNQDCGVCHTTGGFIPATFDHTGIVDNCASCHGSTATPMSLDHIPTSLDCSFCHTTATFVGGTWIHDDTSISNCDSCHNNTGGGASPKSIDHFNTDLQCDLCHTTDGWAPTKYKHDQQGNYPGDHRRDPGCNGCHGNIVTIPFVYPSAQYAPFCAACHAGDFRPEGDHNGGNNGTVEQNKNCAESGCHKVNDSNFD